MLAEKPRAYRTLLAENLGRDYSEYGDDRGKVRLWHLGHRIAICESTGGLKVEHAEFIIDFHARYIESHARPFYSFGNWSGLIAYTADVRKRMTEWQVRARYDELHVSHDSRMLAMSISVANSVLATTIEVHPTEERLDDALLVVRKRHRL